MKPVGQAKRKAVSSGVFHIRLGANIEVSTFGNSENWYKRPRILKDHRTGVRHQISRKYGRRSLF